MMALVTQMVAQGHITGGPADEDAKALMRANGWQPYSVKIGDKYYSYQRMDLSRPPSASPPISSIYRGI